MTRLVQVTFHTADAHGAEGTTCLLLLRDSTPFTPWALQYCSAVLRVPVACRIFALYVWLLTSVRCKAGIASSCQHCCVLAHLAVLLQTCGSILIKSGAIAAQQRP